MYQSSITPEEIDKLGLAAFEGKIYVIDRPGPELNHAVQYLKRQKIIGFDTESRPSFSPGQPSYGVSLLQLSGPNEAFLFRIKLLGMDDRLCSILADSKIAKVGAAVNDDIRGLQRHKDFQPENFIDLQRIVWEYGIKDKSVKKMSAIILGVRISKTQQLSNWEADTLSESQQKYAATDAWICRKMYNKLMKSEKNPLSYEEMHPVQTVKPVQGPAPEENQVKKESGRKRRRRRNYKKKYYKRKRSKNQSDVKDNTEKR
ncbi:MAG: 3'-5' exonuclease domain-containing protein 2 [Bacteroidales bacterium]|nr:3'-5' exonuclease domain-containing protein 2 [Bacteroidales bacterium]